MKTKTLLFSAALTILMMLLTNYSTNAQIPIQGMAVDHEGIAAWNADGSGPEPAAFGHMHPFGWGSSRYYASSRDYDDIDPHPDAALAHLLDDINGFPLFVQALAGNGFSPGEVKIKSGLNNAKNDMEGEDWFTFNGKHYFNKYDGTFTLELNGELMISGYNSFAMCSYDSAIYNSWQMETNYTYPLDASSGSSAPVQEVAAAFLQDMNGEQLRIIYENMASTNTFFNGNGRPDGVYFNVSGYLEKGHPELPFNGLQAHHQGIAAWDADGSGPEPAGQGHIVHYNGDDYFMTYYFASPDYDDIDPDPNAALCQILEASSGFPNLEIQLAYRGYTFDQLKIKSGLSTLGNDEEGIDWGLDGSIHWWRNYGNPVIIEIAGEPILEYMIDTNYSSMYLDNPYLMWSSYTLYSPVNDISGSASPDAQFVALSLLKDIGGQFAGSYMEGHGVGTFDGNGRTGVIHQVDNGYLTLGNGQGTFIIEGDVSGTWLAENSPYMINGNIIVPDGQTLTIEPGVTVAFRGHYHIRVDGRVLAQGTAEENIVFTNSNPTVLWDGLDYWLTPSTNDTSRFEYCVFEHGIAIGDFPVNCGGAIAVFGFSKINIDHCLFRDNQAVDASIYQSPSGGAIALSNSSPVIKNSTFIENIAYFGGVITCASESHPVIDNNIFTKNRAVGVGYGQGYGGAVACYAGSHPEIKNNTFNENVADNGGGALTCISHSHPEIHHNLFYHDTASWGGAIEVQDTCAPQIVNNTIAHNHASMKGGGIDVWTASKIDVRNTILWENTAEEGGSQVHLTEVNDTVNLYYSDIQYGKPGIGGPGQKLDWVETITDDPLFDTINYFLTENSPCVDTGDPDVAYYDNDDPDNPGYALWPAMGTLRNDMGVYGGLYQGIWVSVEEPADPEFNKNIGVDLLCYPNPASDQVIVRYCLPVGSRQSAVSSHLRLTILDLFGREIRTLMDKEKSPGEYTIRMNVSDLPAGVYLVRLQAGGENAVRKLVVQ